MLEHGGGILAAAARYGIPVDAWLDLSTGINPAGWPVPAIPAAIWRRLPEPNDGLIEAAQSYYRTDGVLPIAGSQAAIQALPRLRSPSRVGVLAPSYNEHRHAWRAANHAVADVSVEEIDSAIDRLEVLVLCNPNNPTAVSLTRQRLLAWHARLANRGGWLVVDEAFIDASPEHSVAPYTEREGLIVLRSLGKFFGLAGVRVGALLAAPTLLAAVRSQLGPWTVNGPGRWIATRALTDRDWQAAMRARLRDASERLRALLCAHGLTPAGATALFAWVRHEQAARLHDGLARRGILTRYFAVPTSVRFGLPGSESEWERFDDALRQVAAPLKLSKTTA